MQIISGTTEFEDVYKRQVQRYVGKNISINLGKADALLNESEQVKGEVFKPTERIKVYILEVKNTPKGPVSYTHLDVYKRQVTRLTGDVTNIQNSISGGMRPACRAPVMMITAIAVSFYINKEPVSYTHLDVYKRQLYGNPQKYGTASRRYYRASFGGGDQLLHAGAASGQ